LRRHIMWVSTAPNSSVPRYYTLVSRFVSWAPRDHPLFPEYVRQDNPHPNVCGDSSMDHVVYMFSLLDVNGMSAEALDPPTSIGIPMSPVLSAASSDAAGVANLSLLSSPQSQLSLDTSLPRYQGHMQSQLLSEPSPSSQHHASAAVPSPLSNHVLFRSHTEAP